MRFIYLDPNPWWISFKPDPEETVANSLSRIRVRIILFRIRYITYMKRKNCSALRKVCMALTGKVNDFYFVFCIYSRGRNCCMGYLWDEQKTKVIRDVWIFYIRIDFSFWFGAGSGYKFFPSFESKVSFGSVPATLSNITVEHVLSKV